MFSGPKLNAGSVTEKWRYQIPNYVPHVAISSDGNYIAASYGSNVTLFQKDSNVPLWRYETMGTINDVAISWNGNYIIVCDNNQAYLLNNSIENPKTVMWKFNGTLGTPTPIYVDISFDGQYIAVGIEFDSEALYLLNNSYSQNKKEIWHIDTNQISELPNDVSISGDGNYSVYGGDSTGKVLLFNKTKTSPKIPEWSYDTTAGIRYVEISHTGDYFLAAQQQDEVYLFNTTDYQGIPVWNFSKPGYFVNDIAISADGKSSVVCFAGTLYYLNNTFSSVTSQKEPLWEWHPTEPFEDMDISGDGNYIVVATSGVGTIYLLNNTKTTPKSPQWTGLNDVLLETVAVNGPGDYFVAGTYVPGGPDYVYLFHHDLSKTNISPGGGDDGDDDEKEVAIPFGWYYLLFLMIGFISSLILMKCKITKSKNK